MSLIAHDPFDYSRDAVADHAERAIAYAETVCNMALLRDDDAALHALHRLVFEVRMASAAMKLVVAENQRRDAGDKREAA